MSYIKNDTNLNHWTFFSNHSHVLICLAGDPGITMRDVSVRVGITERAVQRIVAELERAGALKRIKEGRQNRYEIVKELPLRHPLEAHRTIGDVLSIIVSPELDYATQSLA